MTLTATTANNVRVYNVTGKVTSSLPDWLIKRNKRALKRDPTWSQRLNLIQDFEFPQSCLALKQTPDQQHIIASGIYKPQLRIFDLEEMTLKFERHLSTETVAFEVLGEDWKRLALLQADRSVEFHTQFGLHFSIRIPKFGRDLCYQHSNCDLLIAGASREIYRFNLEEGMFKRAYETELSGINSIAINPVNELVCVGGEDACVELWDHRYRRSVASLDISAHLAELCSANDSKAEICKVKFFPNDGITLALGTSTGQVLLYDLRNPFPLLMHDHQYGQPIKGIQLHDEGEMIISADHKSIRIWDRQKGSLLTSIEPSHDINDLLVHSRSGLLMAAVEDKQIQTWFVPSLGPAPKWCSFLENVTEELEQNPTPQTWDNFKFVTLEDLRSLGLEHLLTVQNATRPYMHGYFIEYQVWRKAKLSQQLPATLQELNQTQHEKYLSKIAKSRVEGTVKIDKKLPAINKEFASSLLNSSSDSKQKLLEDTRFKELFADNDFEIDEKSEAYRLINPSRAQQKVDSDQDEGAEEGSEDGSEEGSEAIESKAVQRAANNKRIKMNFASKKVQGTRGVQGTKGNEARVPNHHKSIRGKRRKMKF